MFSWPRIPEKSCRLTLENQRGRRVDSTSVLNDMESNNFECILKERSGRGERRETRECCERIGGEVYDQRGHCRLKYDVFSMYIYLMYSKGVIKDAMNNPRDEWRQCAMERRGVEFADCYSREAREIDDELEHVRRLVIVPMPKD
jgi:hypothetical protein